MQSAYFMEKGGSMDLNVPNKIIDQTITQILHKQRNYANDKVGSVAARRNSVREIISKAVVESENYENS